MDRMTDKCAVNLTRIMRDERILRIARMPADRFGPEGFNVAMQGGIFGTGRTVGEAYEAACEQRHNRNLEKDMAA